MKEQWDELKETIIELRDNNGTATQQGVCKFLVNYMNVLEAQIEQERKRGKWIDTGSGEECSICREIQYGYDNFRHFCPNCGAEMGDNDGEICKP